MVLKIGGSLLKNGRDYLDVAQKIRSTLLENDLRPIVVVSASKGITDLLIQIVRGYKVLIKEVENRYMGIAYELGSVKLVRRVEEEVSRLRRIAESIEVSDPALMDYVLSYGERISKIIMVQALEMQGINAFELNATDIIITNSVHGDAIIDYPATAVALEKIYGVIKDRKYVPVVEGFIGRSSEGEITTIGRGGSDYTATTIAALLKLDKVYLVTDVDGIMTTDPDIVSTAKLVNYMSYVEALEASMYGAKGINPKAFDPLEKVYSSKILIGSWRHFGTTISREIPLEYYGPKVVMLKDMADYSYIAIIGEGVSRAEFLRDVLDIIVRLGVEIKGVQSYIHRPSMVLYVDKSQSREILKMLHKALFEEGYTK
ncbi:MAG: aspartate kinase [Ignisphaera sp.]